MNHAAQIVHDVLDVLSVPNDPGKTTHVIGYVLIDDNGLPRVSLPGGDNQIAARVNASITKGVPLALPRKRRVQMTKEYAREPLQGQALHYALSQLSDGRYQLVRHRAPVPKQPRPRRKKAALLK